MNTFGHIFRVSIFGESHGEEIGVVIDGVEPGIALSESDFAQDIARRRSGAKGTTPRVEADEPHILSGVFEGHTTGAPLTIVFKNTNTRSQDYAKLIDVPRPGHADFTANVKYGGFQDPRGGGHFSGRLTLPVVAAGVVAKKILAETIEEETNGHVQFRCAARLVEIGGIADETRWEGLSHALFAIPGVRGVEFGDGFAAARMKGSEHNDCFTPDGIDGHEGLVTPATNHAGGINGGITNGNPLVFRVAFKPTSSIAKAQKTLDFAKGEMTTLQVPGRHDTCFALRTPVVVEAMAAIVLADLIDIA